MNGKFVVIVRGMEIRGTVRDETKSESRRLREKERHFVKRRRKEVLRLSSRKKVGRNGREGEKGELYPRWWANIAVQRDEGEPRCR